MTDLVLSDNIRYCWEQLAWPKISERYILPMFGWLNISKIPSVSNWSMWKQI